MGGSKGAWCHGHSHARSPCVSPRRATPRLRGSPMVVPMSSSRTPPYWTETLDRSPSTRHGITRMLKSDLLETIERQSSAHLDHYGQILPAHSTEDIANITSTIDTISTNHCLAHPESLSLWNDHYTTLLNFNSRFLNYNLRRHPYLGPLLRPPPETTLHQSRILLCHSCRQHLLLRPHYREPGS